MGSRVGLASVLLSVSVLVGGGAAAGSASTQRSLSDKERAQAEVLVAAVDGVMNGKDAPAEFEVRWHHAFRRAPDGRTYVPFTIAVPADAELGPLAMYTRVVGANPTDAAKDETAADAAPESRHAQQQEGSEYAFEDLHFTKGAARAPVHRAFIVPPGNYTVYVAIREGEGRGEQPPRLTVHREALTVPDYTAGLGTSTVMLAKQVETLRSSLSPEQQLERPYSIGNVAITPSIDGAFTKADLLQIVFVIYNATPGERNKPNVSVDYGFYRTEGGQETFFNKTAPQALNAGSLPAEFDLNAGHLLLARQNLPLGQFPEGSYRLEVTVTDKLSGESVTRSATFSVAPSP